MEAFRSIHRTAEARRKRSQTRRTQDKFFSAFFLRSLRCSAVNPNPSQWRYNSGTLNRLWLALAALFCGAAWGQAPSYSAAGIVNASDYSPAPFAPNSVLSLFGTNMAYSTATVSQSNISGNKLPTQLAGVSVLVENSPAPLLFVSSGQTTPFVPGQINFLVPSDQIPGNVTVQVVRQGVAGPAVTITLMDAAPALFADPNHAGYAMAQDWNAGSTAATPAAPAHPGDMIVLYATGLGHTAPNPDPGEIPATAAYLDNWTALNVLLNGAAIDSSLIKYAGLTPFSTGLYQINFLLPEVAAQDPEIRVSFAGQTSAPGLKLAVSAMAASAGAIIRETSVAGETLNR
jgi:uncharacterized protein (TIGR03437 family)